jgi:lysophospholipase L1-like esterase
MTRILFQGDSITDGGRLKPVECRWDLNHQIGHCYVYPIAAELGRKHPGKYTFINRGVSGDTIVSISDRWQADTLDEHPDILSMLIGINGNREFDGNYPEGLDGFDSRYRALLDAARAQNPDLKIILMEPFVLPVNAIANHFEDYMAVFSRRQAIVRQIAEDYGAIFIPTQERLNTLVRETAPILAERGCDIDPMKYWLWDGVHPTEAFHYYLAELWLEAAKEIL